MGSDVKDPKDTSPDVQEVEVELGQIISDELRRGVYANELSITALRDEVTMDFIQTTLGPPANREDARSEIVARIIVSHSLANRIKSLFDRVEFKQDDSTGDNDQTTEQIAQDGVSG